MTPAAPASASRPAAARAVSAAEELVRVAHRDDRRRRPGRGDLARSGEGCPRASRRRRARPATRAGASRRRRADRSTAGRPRGGRRPHRSRRARSAGSWPRPGSRATTYGISAIRPAPARRRERRADPSGAGGPVGADRGRDGRSGVGAHAPCSSIQRPNAPGPCRRARTGRRGRSPPRARVRSLAGRPRCPARSRGRTASAWADLERGQDPLRPRQPAHRLEGLVVGRGLRPRAGRPRASAAICGPTPG